jgi:hypothetical protein
MGTGNKEQGARRKGEREDRNFPVLPVLQFYNIVFF